MQPEPLIQKLFALERSIESATPSHLREMVVEAQECALAMDREMIRLVREADAVPVRTYQRIAQELAGRTDPEVENMGAGLSLTGDNAAPETEPPDLARCS